MQLSNCSGLKILCREGIKKRNCAVGGGKIDLHKDSFMRKTAESLH